MDPSAWLNDPSWIQVCCMALSLALSGPKLQRTPRAMAGTGIPGRRHFVGRARKMVAAAAVVLCGLFRVLDSGSLGIPSAIFGAAGSSVAFCGSAASERRLPKVARHAATRHAISKQEMNKLISSAETAGAVLDTVGSFIDSRLFNEIHVATAFTKLAKVKATIGQPEREHASMGKLVASLRSFLQSRSMKEQAVANVWWAIASMKHELPDLLSLMPHLVPTTEHVAKDMVPRDVSNVIWACATCTLDDQLLQTLLPTLAERVFELLFLRPDDFNGQDIANIIWSCAELQARGATVSPLLDILPVLSEVAEKRADTMTAQNIANVLWAASLLKDDVDVAAGLIPELARVTFKRSPIWKAKDVEMNLPMIAVALARLEDRQQQPLLKAIAKRLHGTLGLQNDWRLCALMWSFTEVFKEVEVGDFRKLLRAEVQRRGLSEELVLRSQLGPRDWQTR
mmetsp:Transcript_128221/g.409939  ORF Transcript_128221/g.409939 Transcript_128221/m.409939 type:complete len:454 (+) Transcript_128221:23-1384(+)